MRFIFGVLIGYTMRGKEKSIIRILATMAFIAYIVVPTVISSVALLALSLGRAPRTPFKTSCHKSPGDQRIEL